MTPGGAAALRVGALALLASVLLAAPASAQPLDEPSEPGGACVGPGGVVTIEGVGRAVYDQLRTDEAAGSAELYGGVCLEAPGGEWVLRAESISLLDLEGTDPELRAAGPQVLFGPWLVEGEDLVGRAGGVAVEDAVVTTRGLTAHARLLRLEGDTAILEQVEIRTETYLFFAERGVLDGPTLRLVRASGTSCVCGPELYRVAGAEAVIALAEGSARVEGPSVTVLGITIPFGDVLVLEEDGLDLRSPLQIEERSGLGLVVATRGLEAGPVDLEFGASSAGGVWPLVNLSADEPDARVRFGFDARGMRLESRLTRLLAPGVALEVLQEHDLRNADPHRVRGGLLLRAERRLTPGDWRLDVAARAGAEVAAELGDGGPAGVANAVAGPRLPLSASLDAVGPATGVGRPRLQVGGGVTAYPGTGPAQWSARVAPSWRVEGEGAHLQVGVERRWTNGASPFDFDRAGEHARLTLDAAARPGRFELATRAVWRLPPERSGFQELRAQAGWRADLGGGWSVAPRATAELSGLVDGAAEDRWLQLDVPVTVPFGGGDGTLGVRWRHGVAPWTLRALEASAEVPIRFGWGSLTPYLAVDAAPLLLGSDATVLAAHGLRLSLDGCCGTLNLGYRARGDEWQLELGLVLPTLAVGGEPLGVSGPEAVP